MPRRPSKRGLSELPQTDATWHVAVHQMRLWIEEEEDEPKRPWAVVMFNTDNQLIIHSTILPQNPEPPLVAEFLAEAMRRRDTTVGMKPQRPAVIELEAQPLVTALGPQLANIGVSATLAVRPTIIDTILSNLEEHLRGGPEPSGLLAGRGVKPPLVAALFAAAADFYRAALWEQLSDRHVFAVDIPELKRKRFVIVIGSGGMEYGVTVYEAWDEIEQMYQPMDDPVDMIPAKGAHALYYNEITTVPFADLEAIDQYGWEVAADDAYPVPVIFSRRGGARRPQRAELQWYEALLHALPRFVHEELRPGEVEGFAPVEATIPVTTSSGELRVQIKYPGGILPDLEERLTHMMEWGDDEDDPEEELELPDRRAMESILGLLGGASQGPVDEAQEIMYQAWEEHNPAKRVALAHRALQRSGDCADAYVLLAEEAANTLGEALAFYEQGVAAGERALGKRFFKENAGHFWGLLETRPYMRARQGLANTLWELGRKAEASQHFRELLRLNPGDNQGIRYSLLNLSLDMNEDDTARALIQEYPDDGMAEWAYTGALLAFRQHGSGRQADAKLRSALQQNPHIPAYLTGRKRLPAQLPQYMGFGDESEALHYASGYLNHWRRTPGAVEWLKQVAK